MEKYRIEPSWLVRKKSRKYVNKLNCSIWAFEGNWRKKGEEGEKEKPKKEKEKQKKRIKKR